MALKGEVEYTTPVFKVKIPKTKRRKNVEQLESIAKTRVCHRSHEKVNKKNLKRTYTISEGVNLYMTRSAPKKIPRPPDVLLEILKKNMQESGLMTNSHKLFENEDMACSKRGCMPYLRLPLSVTKNSKNSKKCSKNDMGLKLTGRRKDVNSFIAFRSYYSKFFLRLVTQTYLSSVLSKYWASNPEIRRTWEMFAQQYNREKSTLGFVEWLERTYRAEFDLTAEINPKRSSLNTSPYVEDIYSIQRQSEHTVTEFTKQDISFGTTLPLPSSAYSSFDHLFANLHYQDSSILIEEGTEKFNEVTNPLNSALTSKRQSTFEGADYTDVHEFRDKVFIPCNDNSMKPFNYFEEVMWQAANSSFDLPSNMKLLGPKDFRTSQCFEKGDQKSGEHQFLNEEQILDFVFSQDFLNTK